ASTRARAISSAERSAPPEFSIGTNCTTQRRRFVRLEPCSDKSTSFRLIRFKRPARSLFEQILGAAIRALRSAALILDRQVNLRMRVPKRHCRHRTAQRKIGTSYPITVLGIRGDPRFGRWIAQ